MSGAKRQVWWQRQLIWLLLFTWTSIGMTAVAQQPQNPPPPPPGVQKQQKQAPAPERKITDAEAKELFESFDEILQFASKDTGLPIKGPVKHKIVSRDEVEKYMLDRMKDDPDAKRLEASELSLKKFGLIPKDMNLRGFLVALLKEQIAGFYDSKTKVMYLLDWVAPEAQKPVLAHELTHALQDQNYNLDKWNEVNDDKLGPYEEMVRDEERAARQAVVEGQATIVLVDYLLAPFGQSVATLPPEKVDQLKSQMTDGGSTPLFAKAPTFLKLALMFPYDAGFDFERAMLSAGGKLQSYAGVFKNPPLDTQQIMEPKMYLDQKHQPLPKLADLAGVLGTDFEKTDDGGFGEFDVQILVKQWMPSSNDSADGSAASAATSSDDPDDAMVRAWRGGYYMAFHKKGDKQDKIEIAFLLRLATAADAKRFEAVYRSGLKQRYRQLKAKPGGLVDTEDGLLTIAEDGEWFVATEGFDDATAVKVRGAMLEAAKRGTTPTGAASGAR